MAFVLPFVARSTRICAPKIIAASGAPPLSFHGRSFSSGNRTRAAESDEIINSIKSSPMFQKLADSPEALSALKELAAVMRKNGINTEVPPSRMAMLKLLANTEVRTAAANVISELQKAGIDINPSNAMELFTGFKKSEDR